MSMPEDYDAVVHIIDDDQDVRTALTWLFESVSLGAQAYATGSEFLDRYRTGGPACLVVDIRMPEISGLDLQQRLNERGIDAPVIILTGHATIGSAVRSLKQGAFEFLEKPVDEQTLIDSVHAALRTHRERMATNERARATALALGTLTPRERQVLDLVVKGASNKMIARELAISPKTVEIHRSNMMRKMHAGSATELVEVVLRAAQTAHHDG
jgi:FixJ family two-component response regulator